MPRITLLKDGTDVSDKRTVNFVAGSGVAITATDDGAKTNVQFDLSSLLTISRGGTLYASAGLTAGANIIVWRAPFACTVTKVYGFRVGGTGATINARRNGTSNFLSSALSLTSADEWMDGGTVQNATIVAGDELEVMVVSVTGSPTQVAVQVDLTRSL